MRTTSTPFSPPWGGSFRIGTFVETTPDAVSAADALRIHETIHRSRMLEGAAHSWQFEGAYTFTLVFRRDGVRAALRRFPAFRPFVARTLREDCNAFLLNPLVVTQGGGVAMHVDRSLRDFSKTIGCSVATSVLYVDVPRGLEGGAFVAHHRGRVVARVRPRSRMLLTFRGDVAHEVASITRAPLGAVRTSLVLEQYRVTDADLARIPRFRVANGGGA